MAIIFIPIKHEFTFDVVEKQKDILIQTPQKAKLVLVLFWLPYAAFILIQEILLFFIKLKLIIDLKMEKSSANLLNRRKSPLGRGISILFLPVTWILRFVWYIFGVAILNFAVFLIHVTIWLIALMNLVIGIPLIILRNLEL